MRYDARRVEFARVNGRALHARKGVYGPISGTFYHLRGWGAAQRSSGTAYATRCSTTYQPGTKLTIGNAMMLQLGRFRP